MMEDDCLFFMNLEVLFWCLPGGYLAWRQLHYRATRRLEMHLDSLILRATCDDLQFTLHLHVMNYCVHIIKSVNGDTDVKGAKERRDRSGSGWRKMMNDRDVGDGVTMP